MSNAYNPKTDYLKEDPPVPGQNWSVMSFVNPKDHVLDKILYYANNFMVHDINKQITAQAIQMVKKLSVDMRKRISDVLDKLKYSLDDEDKNMCRILEKHYRDMRIDEDEYVEECRRKYELDTDEISDRYKIYLSESRTRLDREYDEAHDHQCSLRGIKTRGNFARLEDARDKAKYLRDNVEPGIHTFVVQTGTWFPIDMDADEVQDQDYMLPQLNELMGKYHEGAHARDAHYSERKREMQEASNQDSQKSVKTRLQEKLKQKRNAQMKQEIAELRDLGKSEAVLAQTHVPSDAPKKNKKKSKTVKVEKTHLETPASV